MMKVGMPTSDKDKLRITAAGFGQNPPVPNTPNTCLLYTSDAADE